MLDQLSKAFFEELGELRRRFLTAGLGELAVLDPALARNVPTNGPASLLDATLGRDFALPPMLDHRHKAKAGSVNGRSGAPWSGSGRPTLSSRVGCLAEAVSSRGGSTVATGGSKPAVGALRATVAMGGGPSTGEGAVFPIGGPITGGSGGPIGMGSGIGGVAAVCLTCGGIAGGSSQSSSPVVFAPVCPLS